MAQYTVMVKLTVEADSENDAYYTVEGAVDNMICGSIFDASVDSINEDSQENA